MESIYTSIVILLKLEKNYKFPKHNITTRPEIPDFI